MFGETDAFNLNSHVYNDDAVGIYLTVRYSNTKKAAADLPDVVGSMISNGGYYALVAVAGVGGGMGIMAIAQMVIRKKKSVDSEQI